MSIGNFKTKGQPEQTPTPAPRLAVSGLGTGQSILLVRYEREVGVAPQGQRLSFLPSQIIFYKKELLGRFFWWFYGRLDRRFGRGFLFRAFSWLEWGLLGDWRGRFLS